MIIIIAVPPAALWNMTLIFIGLQNTIYYPRLNAPRTSYRTRGFRAKDGSDITVPMYYFIRTIEIVTDNTRKTEPASASIPVIM